MKIVKLYFPEIFGCQPCNFHDATPEQIAAVVGGCGPGGLGDYIVPDVVWGYLSIKPACQGHDWQYHWGITWEDKANADNNFRDNMVRIIKGQDSWGWLENLRLNQAQIYFEAVSHFGGPAYWRGKSTIYEMREVIAVPVPVLAAP